jgi:hypothetical protein
MSLFMEQAQEFFEELQGRGVTLRPTPEGKIRFRPQTAVSLEDRRMIKEYKQELINILRLGESMEQSPQSPQSPHLENLHRYGGNTGDGYGDDYGDGTGTTVTIGESEFEARRREQAATLGLVARFSYEFGFISIHDPTTGEWHDVPTADAPVWAKKESFKRKELRKRYESRLLTRYELERIWHRERLKADALDASAAAVSEKGILFEDYLPDSG